MVKTLDLFSCLRISENNMRSFEYIKELQPTNHLEERVVKMQRARCKLYKHLKVQLVLKIF